MFFQRTLLSVFYRQQTLLSIFYHQRYYDMTTILPMLDLKSMPANLNKNMRGVAALIVYDLLTRQNSMKQDDQFVFCFNAFHGNTEKNIISQVSLLLKGHKVYKCLYDTEEGEQVTDRDSSVPADIANDDDGKLFILKKRYSGGASTYVRGVHFNTESLSCPTKARLSEKVRGRNIFDLALTLVRNLKKAGAIADQWLDDGGNLPSGRTWDDLYDHVASKTIEISGEKHYYTGWIAFELLTKYNAEGINHISALTSNGDIEDDEHRSDFRRRKKAEKDTERGIAVGSGNDSFKDRGLTLEARLHIIEMAQMEDEKISSSTQQTIANANIVMQHLLEERKQAISLAQTICPLYDKDNSFWTIVSDLTQQIMDKKAMIEKLTNDREERMIAEGNQSTIMAQNLLTNLSSSTTNLHTPSKSPRKKARFTSSRTTSSPGSFVIGTTVGTSVATSVSTSVGASVLTSGNTNEKINDDVESDTSSVS